MIKIITSILVMLALWVILTLLPLPVIPVQALAVIEQLFAMLRVFNKYLPIDTLFLYVSIILTIEFVVWGFGILLSLSSAFMGKHDSLKDDL